MYNVLWLASDLCRCARMMAVTLSDINDINDQHFLSPLSNEAARQRIVNVECFRRIALSSALSLFILSMLLQLKHTSTLTTRLTDLSETNNDSESILSIRIRHICG